jgi:hypothetical protein
MVGYTVAVMHIWSLQVTGTPMRHLGRASTTTPETNAYHMTAKPSPSWGYGRLSRHVTMNASSTWRQEASKWSAAMMSRRTTIETLATLWPNVVVDVSPPSGGEHEGHQSPRCPACGLHRPPQRVINGVLVARLVDADVVRERRLTLDAEELFLVGAFRVPLPHPAALAYGAKGAYRSSWLRRENEVPR